MDASPLAAWHRIVQSGDTTLLPAILAQEAVFHSPVVHTPQVGRAITVRYLSAALALLRDGSFRYVREIVAAREAVLEFQVEMDGVQVNGVDILSWNDEGLITEFKVMIRPLKAIQLVHQRMAAALQAGQ